MSRRTKRPDLTDIIAKIKESIPILPSDSERQNIIQDISQIIEELKTLQENISRFPDDSEIHQVIHAIDTLSTFFSTLHTRPLLAEAIIPKKTKTRKGAVTTVDTDALFQHLKELPTDKITEELSKHKKDTLFDLSTKMDITVNKKMKKEALVDKIFKMGFANTRGYSLLRGMDMTSKTDNP